VSGVLGMGGKNADAPGPTDSTLILTPTERETLERWTRRAKTTQGGRPARPPILGGAAGKTNTVVAYELPLTKQTVGKWRTRFLRRRLDGLLDEPRPVAPRTITDAQVERVLTQTLETTPADATHWSTRSMAQASRLSRSPVHRIWRAFALQPIGPRRSNCPPTRSSSWCFRRRPENTGTGYNGSRTGHLNRRQLIIIDGIIKLRAV
jgi:hypothetical protein